MTFHRKTCSIYGLWYLWCRICRFRKVPIQCTIIYMEYIVITKASIKQLQSPCAPLLSWDLTAA